LESGNKYWIPPYCNEEWEKTSFQCVKSSGVGVESISKKKILIDLILTSKKNLNILD
jgi:hypothetical protein